MIYKPDSYLYRQRSTSGNEVLVTDNATDFIFSGRAFTCSHVMSDIPIGGKYLLIVPGSNKTTVLIPPNWATTSGPVTIQYHNNHDYSSGTLIPSFNRNAKSIIAPSTSIFEDPTGTTTGDHFSDILVGTSGQGNIAGGGGYSDDDLFVLDSYDLLVYINNHTGSVIDFVSIRLNFYEY